MTEESLFERASELPAAERSAFLDRECAANPALRAQVEALLAADAAPHSPLDVPVGRLMNVIATGGGREATGSFHSIGTEVEGIVIAGRYKLGARIGEGGMGSVWVAQQSEPVKRKVAVKLIKAGMDSKAVLARFEAERQALAVMDHPNIAKVLDGGLHGGRPFFVMELVKGVPITEYCDARKLTPKERLELFVPVCQAIQHAHQKGIIHRDIKPSNVLVALYDDKPVPKVIDFGVAKATGGALTEHTIETAFGGVVGTPQYMSPEQASLNNLDIDTRSDVYSLGVLLYELLTGSPPFAPKELEKRGLLEILRVVREEEPPRPSAKLSTADALPSLSASRGTDPKKLTGLLRNELDWIVMKALEKDRARRYETANGFAADVNRYLSGEAVQAHPPSLGYRLKKFVRRNKLQVIAIAAVFVSLVTGVIGTSLGLLEANRQTEVARVEAAYKETARAEEANQRAIAEANEKTATREKENAERSAVAERQAKEREAEQRAKAVAAKDRARQVLDDMTSGYSLSILGSQNRLGAEQKQFLLKVADYYRELEAEAGDDEASRFAAAKAALRVGEMEEFMSASRMENTLRRAADGFAKLAADFPQQTAYPNHEAVTRQKLGLFYRKVGKIPLAVAEYERVVVLYRDQLNDANSKDFLPGVQNVLGGIYIDAKEFAKAEPHLRAAEQTFTALITASPDSPQYTADLAGVHFNLGQWFAHQSKFEAAVKEYTKAVAFQEKASPLRKLSQLQVVTPQELGNLALFRNGLANALFVLGRHAEAETVYRQSITDRESLARSFPSTPSYQLDLGGSCCNLGMTLYKQGEAEKSLKWLDLAVSTITPVYAQAPNEVMVRQFLLNSYGARAHARHAVGRYTDAIADWDKAIELTPKPQQLRLRIFREVSRAATDQVGQAVETILSVLKTENLTGDNMYDVARLYAVASVKAADKPEEYAKAAVMALRSAIAAGVDHRDHVSWEKDLDPLRERDDFKKLLAEWEKQAENK